jgi:uncharacterized caspase-like protein
MPSSSVEVAPQLVPLAKLKSFSLGSDTKLCNLFVSFNRWIPMWRSIQFAFSFLAILSLVGQTAAPALAQQDPPSAQAEARFAFIVGNDDYEGAPLKTAANDAGLIAETLRNTGFDITGARNLDQDTLRASFREFVRKVEAAGPNSVSAVYLSGYGVQVEGENYLVPANTPVLRDSDVILNGVRLSDFTRALSAIPARAHMVMFDLAYDGPFAKQGQPIAPGLSLVEPEQNVLVSFNAAPGMYAPKPSTDYGPYAQSLAEILRVAGLPLEEVFPRVRTRTAELSNGAQLPWSASHLQQALTLVARAPDAPAPSFDVRQIQEARNKSLRDFSAEEAYSAALDRDTVQAYEEFLAIYPDTPFAKNVRGILAARREALTWERTVRANTAAAYWSYLDRYPKGPHASDARRRLTRLAAPLQPPSSYTALAYDIAPPPPAEIIIVEEAYPAYITTYVPPPRAYYMPPPPAWYQPPPPPPLDYYSDVYYLPVTPAPPPPPWWSPPRYVVAPPVYDRQPGINPYVAIPAALAAGIVAGKLLSNRTSRIATQPAVTPTPMTTTAPSSTTVAPLAAPSTMQSTTQTPTTNMAPAPTVAAPRSTALPPTATPPRSMNQLVNQQGLPQSQVQAPLPSGTQQQLTPTNRSAPQTQPGQTAPSTQQQQNLLPRNNTLPAPSAPTMPGTQNTAPSRMGAPQLLEQQKQAPGARLGPQQQQLPPGAQPRNALPTPSPMMTAPTTTAPTNRTLTAPQQQDVQKQRFAPNTQPPTGNTNQPYQRPMTNTANPPQQRLTPNTSPSPTPQRSAPPQVQQPRPAYTPPQQQQRPAYTPPAAQQPRPSAPVMQQQRPAYTPPAAARPSTPPPAAQPKRNCGGPGQPKCT